MSFPFYYLLENEAKKYGTFEEFKHAWLVEIKHGMYWHLTDNEDFFIDPATGPRDMSSMSVGDSRSIGNLMVTSDLETWDSYYNFQGDEETGEFPDTESGEPEVTRPYAALIDLSDLPPKGYYQVSRGFGNEFWVSDPSRSNVVGVYPIEEARVLDAEYHNSIPQSEKELKVVWESVHNKKEYESPSIHLENAINILSQVPMQHIEEYPRKQVDWYTAVPEPVGYVYHVSPYAREILEQGFIVDPTKTTLGAYGELNSISTTNYENAKAYKEGIRVVVGIANGELSTNDLIDIVGPKIQAAISHIMGEEFINFWNANYNLDKLLDKIRETKPDASIKDSLAVRNDAFRKMLPATYESGTSLSDFISSGEGTSWLSDFLLNDLDFNGNKLSEEESANRRWKLLKAASLIANLPLVVGWDIPEHLKTRTMDDVQIVEVAAAPTRFEKYGPDPIETQLERIERLKKYMEESVDEHPEYTPEYIDNLVKEQMEKLEDPKGVYTYTVGEQEWKFHDVTDLWPVRIVSNKKEP